MSHLAKPTQPILCYVTDRRSLPLSTSRDAQRLLVENVARAAGAGVDWIQLREKDYTGREWSELVRESLQAIANQGVAARILVNDRLDVALACGAGGVHLSENGIPVMEAVRLRDEFFATRGLKKDFLVGVSCHSLGAALGAAKGGADYINFSPIYQTPSKANFGPPHGVERLAKICQAVGIPVLALGGITEQNAPECFQAGVAGVAAIRLFQDGSDLGEVVQRLHATRAA